MRFSAFHTCEIFCGILLARMQGDMPEIRWCHLLENLAANFTKPAQEIADFQKLDMNRHDTGIYW